MTMVTTGRDCHFCDADEWWQYTPDHGIPVLQCATEDCGGVRIAPFSETPEPMEETEEDADA